jgi:putative MATE family efflux protein
MRPSAHYNTFSATRMTTPTPSLHPPAPPPPKLLQVTWPIFAESFLQMLGGLLTIWLVSGISDHMAAVFAMVNQIIFAFMMICRILSIGVGVVVAQHVGGGDVVGARQMAKAALAASMGMGAASCLTLVLFAEPILRTMQVPTELLGEAVPYLRVIGFTFLVDACIFVMISVLRANGFSRKTMWQTVGTQALHFSVAIPLMLGLWGLPKLGIWGLIWGSVFSRTAVFILGQWQWRKHLGIRMHARDWITVHRAELREILHIGLPGAGESLAYRLSFMIIMAMVASMGTKAIATHAYVFQVIHFILLFGMVTGLGTEVVVGHNVGAGRMHQASDSVFTALRWGLCVSTGVAITAALLGPYILRFFTQDAEIIALGSTLLWWCVFLESGRTFNLVVINGLRAAGDVRFPLQVGVVSMFAVAVGLSWLLGVHMGWGLVGVWIATGLDEWLRGLTMLARWRSKAWLRTARKTHRQILNKRKVQEALLLDDMPAEPVS